MTRSVLAAALAGALATLSACATAPTEPGCLNGDVRLIVDGPGLPGSRCTRISGSEFVLHITPEAEPINPSPWYAFIVDSDEPTEIAVNLRYEASRHRYAPWVGEADGGWSRLGPARIEESQTGEAVRLRLNAHPDRMHVAAQPLYLADRYAALEARWSGDWRSFGRSVEGRPLRARIAPPADPASGWILLIGRQHPPEVPGAWALEGFANGLLDARASGALTSGLIIIPLLNPDGVNRGHWRLNAAGADLNRDWTQRRQPEVQAVFDLLDTLGIAPGDLALMVDFHATVADRIYLPQPDELPEASNARLERWLAVMADRALTTQIEPRRTNPARRVSAKTAFTDGWGAVAVTWEAGDNTDEAHVEAMARQGAEAWIAAAHPSQ